MIILGKQPHDEISNPVVFYIELKISILDTI